jgi:hypothetical protein
MRDDIVFRSWSMVSSPRVPADTDSFGIRTGSQQPLSVSQGHNATSHHYPFANLRSWPRDRRSFHHKIVKPCSSANLHQCDSRRISDSPSAVCHHVIFQRFSPCLPVKAGLIGHSGILLTLEPLGVGLPAMWFSEFISPDRIQPWAPDTGLTCNLIWSLTTQAEKVIALFLQEAEFSTSSLGLLCSQA